MLLSQLLMNADLGTYSIVDANSGCETTTSNLNIEEIFTDSRQVVKNGLYIALEGLHTDSHKFVGEAADHGACAAIVSDRAYLDGRVGRSSKPHILILVENTREAFSKIFASRYSNPQKSMTFVGVTGTNGKTSISRMIFEILVRSGNRCGLIGTEGSFISGSEEDGSLTDELGIRPALPLANMTTPDPPELYRILDRMKRANVRYVVMEVTSHSLALSKVAPIFFDIGIFTNLTEDHLDFHITMEEYFKAKKKLFSMCKTAIVNIDDKYGRRLSEELEITRYTCSAEGRTADYNACDVRSMGERGMEYRLASGRLRLRLRTKIPGGVTVMNTLQAAAACNILGVSARDVKDSIASLEGVKGRLERIKHPYNVGFSVYIDYAHTPDALENLLRSAKMLASRNQRIVLLFGCGGEREKQKRAMMGRIASQMSDFFIVTEDNSRSEQPSDIIDEIVSGICEEGHYTVIEDREKAIEYVIKNARDGDIILLAGKGHEEYQIKGNEKREFSERKIVEKYIKRYYG